MKEREWTKCVGQAMNGCQSVTKNGLVNILNRLPYGKYLFSDRSYSPDGWGTPGCLFQDHHRGCRTGGGIRRAYPGPKAHDRQADKGTETLTRIGFGAKAVVTGDVTQIDLARGQKSGLIESRAILAQVRGIAFTDFLAEDVVRHPLVARIVHAYEEHAKRAGTD